MALVVFLGVALFYTAEHLLAMAGAS
jgi:hypothetical protein